MKNTKSRRSKIANIRTAPQKFASLSQAALLDRLAWRAAEIRNSMRGSMQEAA